MKKTRLERLMIAEEMIRRADTVAILTPREVQDTTDRALLGEFDTIFDGEDNPFGKGKPEAAPSKV